MLSQPRNLFGIHSILFYRLSDGKPYGPPAKVLASGGIDLPADFEDLTGGSERFVLASEPKSITPEMKVTSKEFPDYFYQLFMGATVVSNAAEANGNVGTIANKKGTSVVNATTGIASVSAIPSTGPANLKFGKILVVAKSATTVNVLYSSDIDFRRGTDINYQNDELEVLASDVTIATGNNDIASLGLRLVGGSGTIAFTIGDTAEFDVRPPNAGSTVIDIGDVGTEFPEFGAVIYAQKRGNGEMFEIECFRCIGAGLPHNLEEKAFAQAELTIKVLKDFTKDRVMRIRAIKPT